MHMFKWIKKWFANNSTPTFENMTKKQIDDWAASRGIQLDRRETKDKMIAKIRELV